MLNWMDQYNILICAKSRAGKSCFLNCLMTQFFIHKIKPKNIYVFSPTIRDDPSYNSLRNHLRNYLGTRYNEHVFDKINIDVLNKVWDAQNLIKKNNEEVTLVKLKNKMNPKNREIAMFKKLAQHPFNKSSLTPKHKELERIIFILDDVLGDKNISLFRGGLADLCYKNRHLNIQFVFVA